jgi:hypothetical protein
MTEDSTEGWVPRHNAPAPRRLGSRDDRKRRLLLRASGLTFELSKNTARAEEAPPEQARSAVSKGFQGPSRSLPVEFIDNIHS